MTLVENVKAPDRAEIEPELTAADRPFIYLIRPRDSSLVRCAGHATDLS